MRTFHVTEAKDHSFGHFAFPPFDLQADTFDDATIRAESWLVDWRGTTLLGTGAPPATVYDIVEVDRPPVSQRLARPHAPMDENNEAHILVGDMVAAVIRRVGPKKLIDSGDLRGFPDPKQTYRLTSAEGPLAHMDGREWTCHAGLHDAMQDIRSALLSATGR